MHIYIYTDTFVYKFTYTYTNIYIYICRYIYTYIHITPRYHAALCQNVRKRLSPPCYEDTYIHIYM